MLCGLVTFGGAEFVREDLRKPYVIGAGHVRQRAAVPIARGRTSTPGPRRRGTAQRRCVHGGTDPPAGVLATAKYVVPDPRGLASLRRARSTGGRGRAVFRLLCSACHTIDGHLAHPPARRADAPSRRSRTSSRDWPFPSTPRAAGARGRRRACACVTWRGRRMPPVRRNRPGERTTWRSTSPAWGRRRRRRCGQQPGKDEGKGFFDENCAMCHGADGQWPLPEAAAPGLRDVLRDARAACRRSTR